ncbi:hypothetical protein [Ethanoligenens sp.]|uniref:hypothetical protein n=1 Tax=Ethanoligenens sp. TaxID=2099655 RepID=UPI0039EC0EF6
MKRYTKRLTAIIIAVLIALSPNLSLIASADDSASDGTTGGISSITEQNSSGYTISGRLNSPGTSINFYIQFRTYASNESESSAKLYNDSGSLYYYMGDAFYFHCRVNVSEHNNFYGLYTTEVWKMYNDGTQKQLGASTVYVSPITCRYSYSIQNSSTLPVTLNYTDISGGTIASEYWMPKEYDDYDAWNCVNNNQATPFSGNTVSLPTNLTASDKMYFTIVGTDTNGYNFMQHIEISSQYQASLSIGVTQESTNASASPTVNVIATNTTEDQNINNIGDDYWSQDKIDVFSELSAGSDSTNPVPSSNEWEFKMDDNPTGTQNQVYVRTLFPHVLQDNDYFYVGYWYKCTTVNGNLGGLGLCGFFDSDWDGSLLQYSYPDATGSLITDGAWHFNYALVQGNCNYQDLGADYLGIYGTSDFDLHIADLHVTRIPQGSDITQGVTQKWAYGDQPVSYFDAGNGTTFTGHSFHVTQNGDVTVYAKSADGQEAVRTYKVSNYDPYADDHTPPTGSYNLSTSSWTTGNVTINVTAADTQSGVKSITTPGGTVVNGNTCSYTATNNGTYTFILTDNAGNSCTYPVTVSNIDRSVSVSYTSSASYTIDPNNLSSPMAGGEITLVNNNTHIGAKVTLQSLTSSLTGTNGFFLGAQVEETASGNTTWSEIDSKAVQLAGGAATVLGILSPGGTGHIKLVGQLGSRRWVSAEGDTGNMQLTFTAVS